jgi:hypothetical protein
MPAAMASSKLAEDVALITTSVVRAASIRLFLHKTVPRYDTAGALSTLFTEVPRRIILGTSGVEFLEVRLLAFYRVFAREFARGKLEAAV